MAQNASGRSLDRVLAYCVSADATKPMARASIGKDTQLRQDELCFGQNTPRDASACRRHQIQNDRFRRSDGIVQKYIGSQGPRPQTCCHPSHRRRKVPASRRRPAVRFGLGERGQTAIGPTSGTKFGRLPEPYMKDICQTTRSGPLRYRLTLKHFAPCLYERFWLVSPDTGCVLVILALADEDVCSNGQPFVSRSFRCLFGSWSDQPTRRFERPIAGRFHGFDHRYWRGHADASVFR
jgi:hypothetical protein